jgi:hypothetical protein
VLVTGVFLPAALRCVAPVCRVSTIVAKLGQNGCSRRTRRLTGLDSPVSSAAIAHPPAAVGKF